MKNRKLPAFLRSFLWSYDISKLGADEHKEIVITQILNYGTAEATRWLFRNYALKDIVRVVQNPRPGEWNDKSLNFWSLRCGVVARPLASRHALTSV